MSIEEIVNEWKSITSPEQLEEFEKKYYAVTEEDDSYQIPFSIIHIVGPEASRGKEETLRWLTENTDGIICEDIKEFEIEGGFHVAILQLRDLQ